MPASAPTGNRAKFVLDVVTTIAAVVGSGVIVWQFVFGGSVGSLPTSRATREVLIPKTPLSLAGSATKGSREAKVGLVAFSDFQCPFCARFALESLPTLVKEYVDTNRVLFAFRHLPLAKIHPPAVAAAAIAACAEAKGMFWSVHDAFFRRPSPTTEEEFASRAREVAPLEPDWEECRSAGALRVTADVQTAATLKLESTPVFFVGRLLGDELTVTKALLGARPVDDFRAALNAELGNLNPNSLRR